MHDQAFAQQQFQQAFGSRPSLRLFAPGRINLIGEHIDYCGGLVMPMAINRGTLCAFSPNQTGKVRIYSENFGELAEFDHGADESKRDHWIDYAIGVSNAIGGIGGADIWVFGNIEGGGLSSSASFCVAIGAALRTCRGLAVDDVADRLVLARQCRTAENDFVGVSCGIMDQASVCLGGVIKLDCADLTFDRLALGGDGLVWMVLDTRQPRTLALSKYNERVAEIREAIAQMDRGLQMDTLCRQLSAAAFAAIDIDAIGLSDRLGRRLRHVVSEQARVEAAATALATNKMTTFGELMVESHISLRDDYEVTGEALDAIVSVALDQPGVMGARMTGGGFRGCAIALVEQDRIGGFSESVRRGYHQRIGVEPGIFEVHPADGVQLLP